MKKALISPTHPGKYKVEFIATYYVEKVIDITEDDIDEGLTWQTIAYEESDALFDGQIDEVEVLFVQEEFE